jgi:CDP-diacylglycerol--serine O-phosphatidyltransferase
LLLVYLLSYLMISTHTYLSFKHVDIPKEKRFQLIVGMILLLILLASDPQKTLFPALFLYALSGPVLAVKNRLSKKKPQPVHQDNPPL